MRKAVVRKESTETQEYESCQKLSAALWADGFIKLNVGENMQATSNDMCWHFDPISE